MKRLTSILAILVAVFVIGCQENNIMNPINEPVTKAGQLSKDEPVHSLPLNAILREPGNVYNSFLQISGSVAYQTTVVPLDPIPPNPQFAVVLDLNLTAVVQPYSVPSPQVTWSVSGTSHDWVPIPASGSAFVIKRYQIEGRSDRMLLNMEFEVTLTGVELNRMWLELPRREEDGN